MSDIRRNIDLLKLKHMKFVQWNEDGWKIGLCIVPPNGLPYSLLTLANNTCIKETFIELKERFNSLYRRKAHVHHYTDHIELNDFEQARENLNQLIEEYKQIEKTSGLLDTNENENSLSTNIPRLNVLS
jgi:tubulin epsilon